MDGDSWETDEHSEDWRHGSPRDPDALNPPPDDGCPAPGTDDLAGCRGIAVALLLAVGLIGLMYFLGRTQ